MSLALADWVVLIVYLIAMAAIGIIVGLKVKDTDHYFLGKRKFSKWLMIGQSFGQGTHAEMPVSLVGAVYSVGASGIWYQWKNLFATPFYWVMAPVFPPHPANHPRGDERGPLRPHDGEHLHGVRPELLHHQHREHAQGCGGR